MFILHVDLQTRPRSINLAHSNCDIFVMYLSTGNWVIILQLVFVFHVNKQLALFFSAIANWKNVPLREKKMQLLLIFFSDSTFIMNLLLICYKSAVYILYTIQNTRTPWMNPNRVRFNEIDKTYVLLRCCHTKNSLDMSNRHCLYTLVEMWRFDVKQMDIVLVLVSRVCLCQSFPYENWISLFLNYDAENSLRKIVLIGVGKIDEFYD